MCQNKSENIHELGENMKKKTATDMTQGNSLKQIFWFTVPLILGNIFQLTYNTVDTIVVGRFAGNEALAAVGTCDPVMSLLILGVSGICVGASVLMSNFLGAGREEELKREFQTTISMGMIFAFVVLVAGLAVTNLILRMLQTPQEIMRDSAVYLRVIFIGMPFTCLYNIYAAGLRSIGDSSTPVKYLILSCLINIGCDILFVAGFGWGVFGAGAATVLAQAVSAVLCVVYVSRNVPLLHFESRTDGVSSEVRETQKDSEKFNPSEKGDLEIYEKRKKKKRAFFRNIFGKWRPHIDRDLALKTITYGGFSALQQCTQPIGKLFIQGTVNALDSVATIAAFNAIGKVEDIGLLPGRSISDSIMTFVAQNEGAGQKERGEKGFRQGILLEVISGILVSLVVYLFMDPLLHLFTTEAQIIEEGRSYFLIMAFAYWIPCIMNGHQGYFRGIGAMKTVFLGTFTQITIRVITTMLLVPRMGVAGVGIACIAGWCAHGSWAIPYRIWRSSRH